MPDLNKILEERKKKKFIKRKYRPWDLTGEKDQQPVTVKKNDSELKIKDKPIESEDRPSNKEEQKGISQSLDNIKITKRQQKDNIKVAYRAPKDNITKTDKKHLDNVKVANGQRKDNDLDNKDHIELVKKLTGIQRKIFLYIVEICCAKGELETGNISTSDIIEFTNCSYGSIKMSLKRLIDKGLIIRYPGKRSKGGYINLGLTKEMRAAALAVERDKQFIPIIHKQILQKTQNLDNELDNNTETYNNSNKNNIIINKLSEGWENIDFSPLQEIGFSESHLKQIFQSKRNSPEIVQQSIYHFAFALQYKRGEIEKKYKGAMNAIMSVLVKGNSWYEENYESPQEKALRRFLENKKRREMNVKKMIDELVTMEFPKWKGDLSDKQIAEIVPQNILSSKIKSAIDVTLKTYFVDYVLKPKMEEESIMPD